MEFKTVTLPFRVVEYFDIFTLRKMKRYIAGDNAYGEFYFNADGQPKYYFFCFDKNGNTKPEIEGVNNIEAFLSEKIEKYLDITVDKKERLSGLIKLNEMGLIHLELREIVQLETAIRN